MDAEHKIRLLKSGVQDPRGAKSDDVSDVATWRRMAEAIGYEHRSVLRPETRQQQPLLRQCQTAADDLG
jgi:hypothetical protein